MRRFLLFCFVLSLFASCDHPEDPTGRTQTGALGESALPVIFGNSEVGTFPSYDERATFAITNRVRVNTDNLGVMDMDGNIIPPSPPMTYQVGMAEAGKWQGQHALNFSCLCPADPMMEPAAYNSCCQVGFANGVAQCTTPLSACDGEFAMEQQDRWNVLNRGPGQITFEHYTASMDPAGGTYPVALNTVLGGLLNFVIAPQNNAFAPAVSQVRLPPDGCEPPDDSCGEGICVDSETGEEGCVKDGLVNPDCIGSCAGGPRDGGSCIIPEPLGDECSPENYPVGYYWTYAFGSTNEPTPPIADGIHLTFPGPNEGDPGTLAVLSNYYDPNGDPRDFQLVLDGQCIDMALEFDRPVAPSDDTGIADVGGDVGDTGDMGDLGNADMEVGGEPDMPSIDFPAHGDTYVVAWPQGGLPTGCRRYVLAATDAEGFTHSYPSLGSLGMAVLADGTITGDTEDCPIWDATRPPTTCLPVANECNDGDTRLCYTGREGTQGKGECTSGTETCARGRWSGVCSGEVLPTVGETCADQVDNNCNGFTDEGCPVLVVPVDMGGNTTPDVGTAEDMGQTTEDVGPQDMGPPVTEKPEDDGCCATTADRKQSAPILIAFAFFMLAGLRRRK